MSVGELSSTFRVGSRWRCTMSLPLPEIALGGVLALRCEWLPAVPGRLSPDEIADYRRGRDALLGELARVAGLRTLVAELGTGEMAVIEPASIAPKESV